MAIPTTREEFAELCLQRLGKPVINIEVTDDQVDLAIDEALAVYRDHHYDASSKVYYKHLVTEKDKQRRYITLPDSIHGVTRIFDVTGIYNGNNIFDIRYQIALNDLYTLTQQSMVPFFMTMQHLELLNTILTGAKPIRFQRHQNRLYIDMNWKTIAEGIYIVVECYQNIDPEEFEDVWSDRWLQKYTTALVKRQWGNNLKKFSGVQMPGGIQFNGQIIYDEAIREIEELDAQVINDFSYPLGFEMG